MKAPKKMKEADTTKLVENIRTCLQKGYLIFTHEKEVKSYIDYSAIPKDLVDIRIVFNGSSCGLNLALFASNFWLPMSNTMTRILSFGYRVVDMDVGEMFPNFLSIPL